MTDDNCPKKSPTKNMIDAQDQAALKDMRNNGHQGLEFLYKRYALDLTKRIMARYKIRDKSVANAIKDDAFYYFYIHIKNFQEKCSVYTWLCLLAHYEFLKYYSKEELSRSEEPSEEPYIIYNLNKELCYERCYQRLLQEIIPLSKSRKEYWLSVLWKGLGFSTKEIAEKIGRTHGATRVFTSGYEKCWDALTKIASGTSIETVANEQNKKLDAMQKFLSECGKKLEIYDSLRNCFDDCKQLEEDDYER